MAFVNVKQKCISMYEIKSFMFGCAKTIVLNPKANNDWREIQY